MINPEQTVTHWIQGIKGGDEDAAARIWDRFFRRVCGLARKRLGPAWQGARDPEDLALSAIHALCDGARNDRFQRLEDRGDLWALLAMITIRKAISAQRKEGRRPEVNASTIEAELDQLADGKALTGLSDEDYLDVLSTTSRELLERLEPDLRTIALLRLEGFSNAEIAERQSRSIPTIERRLRIIRHAWNDE